MNLPARLHGNLLFRDRRNGAVLRFGCRHAVAGDRTRLDDRPRRRRRIAHFARQREPLRVNRHDRPDPREIVRVIRDLPALDDSQRPFIHREDIVHRDAHDRGALRRALRIAVPVHKRTIIPAIIRADLAPIGRRPRGICRRYDAKHAEERPLIHPLLKPRHDRRGQLLTHDRGHCVLDRAPGIGRDQFRERRAPCRRKRDTLIHERFLFRIRCRQIARGPPVEYVEFRHAGLACP